MSEMLIPKLNDHAAEATRLLARSQDITIVDDDTFRMAAADLQDLNDKLKFARNLFLEPKRRQDEAKKALLQAEKSVVEPLSVAVQIIKDSMASYRRNLERKREEKRLRLQAEADEKARREREALEKKAAAAKKPETKERYEQAAAQVAAPMVAVAEPVKAKGVTERDNWKFEITNRDSLAVRTDTLAAIANLQTFAANSLLMPERDTVMDLIDAIIDTLKMPDFLMVDEKRLGQYARAMKQGANVPGVRFYNDPITVVRS